MEMDISNIQNAISGYVLLQENLSYYKKVNVVLRSDYESMKKEMVRIISDQMWPTNIGYIGNGMTTACTTDNILRAILMTTSTASAAAAAAYECGSDEGGNILTFINNPLNGYAIDTARIRYGYNVQCIQGVTHPVESIILQKIAGAMAANNASLRDIKKFCSNLRRISVTTLDKYFLKVILDVIPSAYDHQHKPKIIVIFNSIEMDTCYHLLKALRSEYEIGLILQGNFCPNEPSLTVFDYDERNIVDYLKQPICISANAPFNIQRKLCQPNDHPVIYYDPEYLTDINGYQQKCYQISNNTEIGIEINKKIFENIIVTIKKCKAMFEENESSFVKFAETLDKSLSSIDLQHPCIMFQQLAHLLYELQTDFCIRLAIILQGAAEAFIFDDEIENLPTLPMWLLAARFGLKAIDKYFSGSLNDGLRCGVEAFEQNIGIPSVRETIDEFANGCENGAENYSSSGTNIQISNLFI